MQGQIKFCYYCYCFSLLSVFVDYRLPSDLSSYIKNELMDITQFYSCGYWHYHSAICPSSEGTLHSGVRVAQDAYYLLLLFQTYPGSPARDFRPNLSRRWRAFRPFFSPSCILLPPLLWGWQQPSGAANSAQRSLVLCWELRDSKVERVGEGG